ncbi:MAG: hypothetical protein OXF68_16660 [Gammaproteobacteria bacterium]|nr:hypothetical protein [Gammaproteobacteria bacterium]
MAIQDDRRELEMCALLGLRLGEGRSEVDAFLDFEEEGLERFCRIELKSTTTDSVSTARDVGPNHIQRWRNRVWVFGFYDRSGTDLARVLALGPDAMEAWIGKVESYVSPDFALGERVAEKLDREDLDIICGRKDTYELADAQALMKRQWSKAKYASEMDVRQGYTPAKMLEILRQRALYVIQRGSTLNNPHIPKSFFSRFNDLMLDVHGMDLRTLRETIQRRIRLLHPQIKG